MDKTELITKISDRATHLYKTNQLFCSEALFVTLNEAFAGDLTRDQAIAMTSAMPMGVGDKGCLCGALNSGLLALGFFMSGEYSRKEIRKAAADLYDKFTGEYKSTCCKVLCKKVKAYPKDHFKQCTEITRRTTEMTTNMILEKVPSLAKNPDEKFVNKKNTTLRAIFSRVAMLFK